MEPIYFYLIFGVVGVVISGAAMFYIFLSIRKGSLRSLEAARILVGDSAIEFEYPGAVVDPGHPHSREQVLFSPRIA